MKSTRLPVAGALALALLAPAALADTSGAPKGARQTAAVAVPLEHMKPDRLRVSKLIGKTVYASDGKDVGDVADLILDRDGRVEQIVVAVGGVVEAGDKRIAVPIEAVKWGVEGRLTVAMSRDEIEAYPGFDYGDRTAGAGSSLPPRGRRASGAGAPAPRRSP